MGLSDVRSSIVSVYSSHSRHIAAATTTGCSSSSRTINVFDGDLILSRVTIIMHVLYIREQLEKLGYSPYYSKSELCGGAVTASFSKYLAWQALHFLQRSTHFSKTCCRLFAASFRRTVEQAVLGSWSLRAQSSVFMVSLHRLHRPDGWVVGFQNSIAQRWRSTKEICNCSAILKRVLLKRP
jgi:hypothetical protein